MSELYWLNVLGYLHDVGAAIAVLSLLVSFFLGFWIFMCATDGEEILPIIKKKCLRVLCLLLCLG